MITMATNGDISNHCRSSNIIWLNLKDRSIHQIEPVHESSVHIIYVLTLNFKETPFNTFANRVDPDQAALVRAA